MGVSPNVSRRHLLAGFGGATAVGFAGCVDLDDIDPTATDPDGPADPDGPPDQNEAERVTADDVRGEVNVVGSNAGTQATEIVGSDHRFDGGDLVVELTLANVADETDPPLLDNGPITGTISLSPERYGDESTEFEIPLGERSTIELRHPVVSSDRPDRYEVSVESELLGPDPTVVDTAGQGDLGTLATGTAEVTITVVNRRGEGLVTVEVEVYDGDGRQLNRLTRSEMMAVDEQEIFTFRVSIDDGAEYYEATATG